MCGNTVKIMTFTLRKAQTHKVFTHVQTNTMFIYLDVLKILELKINKARKLRVIFYFNLTVIFLVIFSIMDIKS